MLSCARSNDIRMQRGFTVPELLLTAFLGLLISGLFLTLMQANRNVLGKDIRRTTLNQSLRGALDIVAADVRVGGENLGAVFPAIEVVNGSAGASDILTVRRNLLDEILPVCIQIDAGSSVSSVYFAIAGTVPGCVYSGQTHNYQVWRDYRLAQPGDETLAYIFNSVTRDGEFFTYTAETDNGIEYYLTRSAGTWQNTYPVGSSAIYILEEWSYDLQGENLALVENRDTANPFNVSFGITDFQIEIAMQDGTTKTSFVNTDDWTTIRTIRIQLSGAENYGGEQISKTLTGEYFPRNILSH